MNEAQGLVASLFLLVAVFLYTFWPGTSAGAQRVKTKLDYLLERKEQLNENLRDLDFEFRAGKYPEEDFLAQKALLDREISDLQADILRLQQV